MNRFIRIFKSLEEQEQVHLEKMRQSTVVERFCSLYQMQPITKLLHPSSDTSRKIIIRKWDKDIFDIARLEEIRNSQMP